MPKYSFYKLALLATTSMTLLFCAGCSERAQEGDNDGTITRVIDLPATDLADALNVELYKFEWSMNRPEKYKVNVWLQETDMVTSRTSRTSELARLSGLTALSESDKGSLLLSISDPATTGSELNKVWRVVSVVQMGMGEPKGVAGRKEHFILNRFEGMGGVFQTLPVDSAPISVRSDVALISWYGGERIGGGETYPHRVELMFRIDELP